MPTVRDTPTPQLEAMRDTFRTHLTWGLSKQARKSTEIKLRAVELVLAERKADHANTG